MGSTQRIAPQVRKHANNLLAYNLVFFFVQTVFAIVVDKTVSSDTFSNPKDETINFRIMNNGVVIIVKQFFKNLLFIQRMLSNTEDLEQLGQIQILVFFSSILKSDCDLCGYIVEKISCSVTNRSSQSFNSNFRASCTIWYCNVKSFKFRKSRFAFLTSPISKSNLASSKYNEYFFFENPI
jgi:hypothetical protein